MKKLVWLIRDNEPQITITVQFGGGLLEVGGEQAAAADAPALRPHDE